MIKVISEFKCDNPQMKIMIIMGGLSSEREISLDSGHAAFDGLKTLNKYDLIAVDFDCDFSNVVNEIKPDFVFNAMHGLHGEDGAIAGMLEVMGVKYSHSGIMASAIGMNKAMTKLICDASGIRTPKGMILDQNIKYEQEPIARPFVIKPIHEGSSFGVDIIFEEDDFDISKYEFKFGNCLIEEYIPGQEVHVAVIGNKAIGAIELKPTKRFYDYEAKYTEGVTEHVFPAEVPKKNYDEMMNIAEKLHDLIECSGVSRVDFRFDNESGLAYVLEINTHPGMTSLSLVPEIASHCGIEFPEFLDLIIKSSL